MRIGGLASGMDIDSLVNQLMAAERIPLNKMQQDKTLQEWERDGFRDVNKKLLELDNMMLDMKLSHTYNPKTVNSSMEDAVTATGNSSASNGTYDIKVNQLASSAINVSQDALAIDPKESLTEQGIEPQAFEFFTFDEDGKEQHEYEIKEGDTLEDVLSTITNDDNHVRAFFDEQSQKVVMETTRPGNYNQSDEFLGAEIGFDRQTNSSFITDVLQIKNGRQDEFGNWHKVETGGENAKFTYNGALEIESEENNYTLNGVNFEFKNTTGDTSAKLTVNNDVDAAFDSIMEFVDKYNEVVETLNETQQEEKFRDYPPLTDEQKEEMSEREIELWEERAMSGILRGESAISGGLFSMRQSWYSNVDTGGEITSLTQIGITTTSDYLDGGKLEVDEDELKKALREDPDGVQALFSNDVEGVSRGLVNRLEDAVEQTMGRIEARAGNGMDTLENYTLGKRLKDMDDRISAFEDRLTRIETRYWNEFGQMEQAISRMNQQSMMLMNQFGGGSA
ncbi:flagellar hook-associated protein 2 [Virgibacillus sp. NKC19-16]|uniref:flagellar hook-associated protein 2 n=1 Tax=Virgibacillus salidurans TaxID=2831673 RepID=UPI001F28E1F3|nr:flagellar hook-associated protein 2 [Virgibacillus sp. NKC19-16]UJL45340.1 flagellar hook-associated protein 2 [Virgibacillus sp. NKC19-16]